MVLLAMRVSKPIRLENPVREIDQIDQIHVCTKFVCLPTSISRTGLDVSIQSEAGQYCKIKTLLL